MAELTPKEQEIADVMKKLEKSKGKTQDTKGVYIPKDKRAPYKPEYLKMSKADVIAAEKKRKEDDAKIAVFREELKNPKVAVKEEVKETPKAEVKPAEPVADGESAVVKKAKSKKK